MPDFKIIGTRAMAEKKRAVKVSPLVASLLVVVFSFLLIVNLQRWWEGFISHCILPEDFIQFVRVGTILVSEVHLARLPCPHRVWRV